MLVEIIACVCATLSLALLLGQPKRTLFFTAAIALTGYLVFVFLNQSFFAYFVSGLIVGILCEITARITKTVASIYLVCGIIPMVPGLGLYRAAEHFVNENYDLALETLLHAFGGIGAIALALTVSTLIFLRFRISIKHRIERN
ncbi:MAG: threonine/serine exporter family protein [Eubacteriales bacterium]|nr:threonine/serine exporter family protein [Eubacteriales bacterium]